MAQPPRWLPLEANPDVLNEYAHKIGVPEGIEFHDILGLDDELLAMVPQPVLAVLLLYPISKGTEEMKAQMEAGNEDESVWFTKQTVGNACGTVGLMHSLANNADEIGFASGTPIGRFLAKVSEMDADGRAKALETSEELAEGHGQAASSGATEAADVDTNLHFVCLVNVKGKLLELDGRQRRPIKRGSTSKADLLKDSTKVIQEYIDSSHGDLNFNAVALTKRR